MGRWATWLGLLLGVLMLVGCGATGPRYSEIESKLPPLAQEQGRIFFYRSSAFGAAVQPEVRLNGQLVGLSQPNSFFFVDRPAGEYKASAKTESEATLNVKVQPMAVSYVAMGIGFGIMVGRPTFSMVTESQAKSELPGLAYGGNVPVSTQTASTAPAPMQKQSAPPSGAGVAGRSAAQPPAAAAAAPAATVATAPPAPGKGPFAKASMQDLQFLLPAAP